MGVEIERKFLIQSMDWKMLCHHQENIQQGYLSKDIQSTIRIRIIGDLGKLTIKGKSIGISRSEFEYDIPLLDAQEMLQTLCPPPLIHKIRYYVNFAGHLWEIDEFLDHNKGLFLAEIELDDENAAFEIPDWIGKEVSMDVRFRNSYLAQNSVIDILGTL